MKIGFCSSVEKFIRLRDADPENAPDYCEVNCSPIAAMSEGDFAALLALQRENAVPVYSCNGLIPGDIRLTGENYDPKNVRAYAERAFSRIAALGGKVLVFGSSTARKITEGFSPERAKEQLVEAGRILSDVAAPLGLTIAIEPLRRAEDNIVNTLADGAALAGKIARENVRLLADFYHIDQNGEPLSDILRFRDILIHCHICSPVRDVLREEDRAFAAERMAALAEAGYRGRISFEGKWSGETEDGDAKKTIAILRQTAAEAGL